MEIIRFENISKSFGDHKVLDDFSLTVSEGELLTVIGRSGCGKSTMLKMINGLHTPDSGTVRVFGEDIKNTDLISLRRRIGWVIQNKGLFPHMTVEKNITYVPDISGEKNKDIKHSRAVELVNLVGLDEDVLSRYPLSLSGGQQQRVGIARALAANPRILLMDEPFGALDQITKHALQQEVKKLHENLGVTIIFITHDIHEAMNLGDRVLVMGDGGIIQLGTPEEIKSSPANDFVRELTGF